MLIGNHHMDFFSQRNIFKSDKLLLIIKQKQEHLPIKNDVYQYYALSLLTNRTCKIIWPRETKQKMLICTNNIKK